MHLLYKLTRTALLGLMAGLLSGCGALWSAPASRSSALPAAAPLAPDDGGEMAMRFLEARVKRDPEDFIAYNKLAGYYLQRLRETGDLGYLNLTSRAARASLAVLPAEQNPGGLHALAQAEYAAHEFAAARDRARQLAELVPHKSYPHQLLGDALLELGDYEGAAAAYRRMERVGGRTVSAETRLARTAWLRGETEAARRRLEAALALALDSGMPSRETVAWCRWQLGETAYSVGDYEAAERHYRDALTTFPDYYRALAGLGRVRAARGDVAGAIEQYQRAVSRLPDPSFVAALGDLYHLAGRRPEAEAQYALVEQIARLSAAGGAPYNRQLALFYADHDLKAETAYTLAVKEYSVRRDIYGADALAWTALKAGRLAEARAAAQEALRLGTRDARIYYHAGMIYYRLGDRHQAEKHLRLALETNPSFDVLQADAARQTLDAIKNSAGRNH